MNTHRTEVATLRAKGAWNVADADTSETDCVASATGPNLPYSVSHNFRSEETNKLIQARRNCKRRRLSTGMKMDA